MGSLEIKHQIATYFGGEYDEERRAYLDPQVDGLGVVKRARGKRSSARELHGGMDTEEHGTAMLVHIGDGIETRKAVGGSMSGMKLIRYGVVLHVFLHSTAERAEDAQDAFDALCDGLRAHIHADRTLGSGGFEARLENGDWDPGGFQVGEGEAPGIAWEMDLVETSGRVTRGYLGLTFFADQYIYA